MIAVHQRIEELEEDLEIRQRKRIMIELKKIKI